MTPPKLGIIACGGHLPARLIDACRHQGRPFFVLAIEGVADMQPIVEAPHARVALGSVGDALRYLRSAHVDEVVLAGSIRRPAFNALKVDAIGAKLLARMGLKLMAGDDALLKEIVRFLENEGFAVVGADEVMRALIAPASVLSTLKPDRQALADIALGFTVVKALGALDIGQAAVVENGYVLGVEAAEGTDALIGRMPPLMREAKRAVLVKACKPGQDARVDLPTIGAETVRRAHQAGLMGIAVEAGATLLLARAEVAELADEYGMFVCGMKPE